MNSLRAEKVLPRWVSIQQAMDLMQVSRRTIYNWIAKGRISYVETASGRTRIVTETLWRKPSIH